MTALNGTEERLDALLALLAEILAELRKANAVTTVEVTTHSTGAKPKKK